MDIRSLRNLGIIAHIDAGKTTFTERILYYTHVIHRMGEVHEGAATMDFLPEEQERGITIAAACISCNWNDCTLNIVDTPGHVDFTVEVERCLRVLDGAVGIFCAVGGVEPQSETVWRQADFFAIPRLAVINKMDRVGASFENVLLSMQERLGVRPLPLVIPFGEGEAFTAVLDLVREQRIEFPTVNQGSSPLYLPFSDEDRLVAEPYQERLLDMLTELDDGILEAALEGSKVAPEYLDAVIRRGVLARAFIPVFAASALRNIAVQPVLDGVCRYLPNPYDTPPAHGIVTQDALRGEKKVDIFCDAEAPFCALVFKVLMETTRKVIFLRIYAGTLKEGDTIVNMTTKSKQRVQRIYRVQADQKEQLECAKAGDIVAVLGCKDAHTGDTLAVESFSTLLEPIKQFHPVISLAFEPKNTEDGELLDAALFTIAEEDPTITVTADKETGQRIVSGMGELHLGVVIERIEREFKLTPRVGKPQVVCRSTLTKLCQGQGEFDRDIGGQRQYAMVQVSAVPKERGSGVEVRFGFDATNVKNEFLAALERGVYTALTSGFDGKAFDDVVVTVTEASLEQDGKTTEAGLHMAAQMACMTAFAKGSPVTLEPLMQVTITVPEDFLGSVMSLLGMRSAKVENVMDREGTISQKSIVAVVPMREMFGFSTALRSVSQGRSGFVMQFLRFDAL